MTFTALEALLLSAFVSCVIGIVVRVRSVSPEQCRKQHEMLEDVLKSIKTNNDIQFRMFRAIVPRLGLPASEVAAILNMTPSGKE